MFSFNLVPGISVQICSWIASFNVSPLNAKRESGVSISDHVDVKTLDLGLRT